MSKYTVGLAFNSEHTEVLMQLKLRGPAEHVAGWLNGPGGKHELNVNKTETPVGCMVREFYEETGIESTKDNWLQFHYERRMDTNLELYFYTTDTLDLTKARQCTDEPLCLIAIQYEHGWFRPRGLSPLWLPTSEAMAVNGDTAPQNLNADHFDANFWRRRKDWGMMYNMPYLIPMALIYLEKPQHRYLEG